MKLARLFVIIGLVLPICSLWAQNQPDWYLGKPIQAIRFEGLAVVQQSELEGVVRQYVGKKFTDELFQDLQGALYNLDFFEGLIVPNAIKGDEKGNEVVLVFKVQEKPVVDQIVFTGNSRLREGELTGAITIKRGDLINLTKIKSDEKALQKFYLEKGFLDAQVTSTNDEPTPQKARVQFVIKEGLQTSVKKISFRGLSFSNEGTLKGLMETKEQDFFNPGLFKEAAFSKDVRAIESYYWNRGYIDAKVVDIQRPISFDKELDRNVLNIEISIVEGQPYIFKGFTFNGNNIFSVKELTDLVRSPVDGIVNKERVEADYQRIVDLYLENGYIFNQIGKKEIREGKNVSYTVSIVERPRAHIENILIKGNTRTKDKVILRELPFEVGDVFSKTKIINGIYNLRNLQFFNNVVPETPQGSADGLMDLILNVEEGKTADISFGLTFSGNTEFPVSANVKWQDKNFLGNGQTFGVDSSLSPITQSINLNFTENWFLDQRLTIGGSIGFNHSVNSNITQDVLGPISNSTEFPDPYDPNDYVFVNDTTYNSVAYKAGQSFPGIPTTSQIDSIPLVSRYQYDLNSGKTLPPNTMQYDSWQFNLGLNTGYSWYTMLGRFGLSTGLKSSLQSITYDDKLFRPSNKSVRDNLNVWLFNNQWITKAAWDTRDIISNPTNGAALSETLTVAGGFLGGSSSFTRYDTKAEAYYKFFEYPLFDFYTFQLVGKARSSFSFLADPWGGSGSMKLLPTDELYVDGMFNGRGWGYQRGAKVTWNSGVELRMPVIPNLLWLDTFVDQSTLVFTNGKEKYISEIDLNLYHFSWGTGLRIISPQFPISIYVAKPFTFQSGNVVKWEKGDGLFGSSVDMKLVVSFGFDF